MAKNPGTPFLDTDFSQYLNVGKFTEQFKLPGVDTNVFLETQQKNLEAVAKANKVALDGVQAVAQRQTEIVRQAFEESATALQALATVETPQARMAKQAELFKQAFEASMANFRELAEISAKSNGEAVELLNSRLSQSMDEVGQAINKAA
jgi:phasin family protein